MHLCHFKGSELNSFGKIQPSKCAKTAVFAISKAVNFGHLVNFSVQKVQKSKFRASKCGKMADFALQESAKLISRKIYLI